VVEVVYGDRRECRTCGRDVIGTGDTLRHYGEEIVPVFADPPDERAFSRAMSLAESATRGLPADAPADDRGRRIVEALYVAGWLRRRPGPRRGELDEPQDREPDAAERRSLSHV